MENINLSGSIDQPRAYNDFGIPEFIVEEILEDTEYLHIRGEVGYIDKDLKKINNEGLEIQLSKYDGIEFYFKYNKNTNIIELTQDFRTTTCDKEEYDKFANKWFYNKEVEDFNDGYHFPYFRLPRSKDCVLIPHFIAALWKSESPKISIIF